MEGLGLARNPLTRKENSIMIDHEKISPPTISLSHEAARQLHLMFQHDPTLQNRCFRIHIQSKGCEGFRYALGMGENLPQDFIVKTEGIDIHLDPFCAFYLQEGTIDYIVLESGEDGFTITNTREGQYRKKFWKKDPKLIPPQQSESTRD